MDHNGAQAAIRAGYSPRSARETAHRLLTKDDVREAVDTESTRLAEALRIKRGDAILRLVQAAEDARRSGNTREVIRAWREVALLLGFYPGLRYPVRRASPSAQT